jgi:hypothetical protein
VRDEPAQGRYGFDLEAHVQENTSHVYAAQRSMFFAVPIQVVFLSFIFALEVKPKKVACDEKTVQLV